MAASTSGEWPVFQDGSTAAGRWTRPDGKRRIYVILLADGTYTWGWQESSWLKWGAATIARGARYDSFETACTEIPPNLPEDLPWIRKVEIERRTQAPREAGAGTGWEYWGDTQMLPCPFCGQQMERARVQMVLGGGGDVMSTLTSMAAGYDTSKGGKHIKQTCENCGKTFESRLAPDADAAQHGGSFHQWRPGPV